MSRMSIRLEAAVADMEPDFSQKVSDLADVIGIDAFRLSGRDPLVTVSAILMAAARHSAASGLPLGKLLDLFVTHHNKTKDAIAGLRFEEKTNQSVLDRLAVLRAEAGAQATLDHVSDPNGDGT